MRKILSTSSEEQVMRRCFLLQFSLSWVHLTLSCWGAQLLADHTCIRLQLDHQLQNSSLYGCKRYNSSFQIHSVSTILGSFVLILRLMRESWFVCHYQFSRYFQVGGQLVTEFYLAFTNIYSLGWPIKSQHLSRLANQKQVLWMAKYWPLIGQPRHKRVSCIRPTPQFKLNPLRKNI